VKEQLGALQRHRAEIRDLFVTQQVNPWSQAVWSHACDYSARVAFSEQPEDLAVVGAVGKFGLAYAPEAVELVRGFQHAVVAEVGDDEYEDIIGAMTRFVEAADLHGLRPAHPGPPAKSAAAVR
jgi:hypothetical protein